MESSWKDRRSILKMLAGLVLAPGAAQAARPKQGRTPDALKGAVEPEASEARETPGVMHSRLLNEYTELVKRSNRVLDNESTDPRDIFSIISVPTVSEPEQYEAADRQHIYGRYSDELRRDNRKMPTVPMARGPEGPYYNSVRIAEREVLTLARALPPSFESQAQATLANGIDAAIREFRSIGEHASRDIIKISDKSTAELHATRAVVHGLAYQSRDHISSGERAPALVAGVLFDHARLKGLSRLVVSSVQQGSADRAEREVRERVTRGLMLFVPALGHHSVRALLTGNTTLGAPLLDENNEIVGLLARIVTLSYRTSHDPEPVTRVAFLVEPAEKLKKAPKISTN